LKPPRYGAAVRAEDPVPAIRSELLALASHYRDKANSARGRAGSRHKEIGYSQMKTCNLKLAACGL
ncbi:MAG TPA: hypothetical protein PLI34_17600, partial [Saprospiraceae bacterium]|nr:hypothetical protein [Saprospiraceae bacterium]